MRSNIRIFSMLLSAPSTTTIASVAAAGARGLAGVTHSTCVLTRGADAGLTASIDASDFGEDFAALDPSDRCAYDGTISLSHPMSLKPGDRYFSLGQQQLNAMEMMVDEINTRPRCGISVGGRRYGLRMTTYGDDSSRGKVEAIVTRGMVPAKNATNATFWLAPYSSGLTGVMSRHANDTSTILVAGGSAFTSVFEGYPTVFGTPPPTEKYLAQGVESLARAGARTFASVWEDAGFTRGVCAALPDLAAAHGLVVQSQTQVAAGPAAADLDPVAMNLSRPGADPDVVVTCVYDAGCAGWVRALRRARWSPRAQVFTVCVGMDSFANAAGKADAAYMTGVATWDPGLAVRDAVVGWNASEFSDRFLARTGRRAAYQGASAAAAVGALVQAIERADGFDPGAVASVLANEEFDTVFGRLSFDENGQSKAPSLHLQYDGAAEARIVYPPEARSRELVYPMPTWAHRDCMFKSMCETGSAGTSKGKCQEDGTCACDDVGAQSSGVGPDAACYVIPVEDYTYIVPALRALGIILFSLQLILTLICAAWTVRYRERRVVKASQPLFLCLICFGAFVMSMSIIPLGIQGRYRFVKDETAGDLTDERNPEMAGVDAACMALPWLFSIGFSIVFSALFAKIWRVHILYKAAQRCVQRKIDYKDVALIMVIVIAIQVIILLCWQLIDPLRWQREVLFEDANGYATKSVGHCKSENTLRFLVPLVTADGLMLLYALYLCFVTRKVPSDYQEGTWVSASVLSFMQILILAIPILVIVDNDTNAFYFVRAVVIFLMASTVTTLIFVPKIYRQHFSEPVGRRAAIAGTPTSVRENAAGENQVTSVEQIRRRVSRANEIGGSNKSAGRIQRMDSIIGSDMGVIAATHAASGDGVIAEDGPVQVSEKA